MDLSEGPIPIEDSSRHSLNPLAIIDDHPTQTHVYPGGPTQQITSPSATDQSAIISSAGNIGTVENNRYSIKQAFFYIKRNKGSNPELNSYNTAGIHHIASTRTTSFNGYQEISDGTFLRVQTGSSETSTQDCPGHTKGSSQTDPHQYNNFKRFRHNRRLSILVLGLILVCIVVIAIIAGLYASHVLPLKKTSSAPSTTYLSTPYVESSISKATEATQSSLGTSSSISPLDASESIQGDPSSSSSAASPIAPASQLATTSSVSPVPSSTSLTMATATAVAASSTLQSVVTVTSMDLSSAETAWFGGNIGDKCNGSDGCSNPWPCVNGFCATTSTKGKRRVESMESRSGS